MFFLDVAAAGIRLATPIFMASVGETFSQRAGVVNVGLEGMMLVGAFTGVMGAHYTGNPWIALLAAAAGGLLVALIHGLVSITLAGNQVVSGIALNLAALGITGFLTNVAFGGQTATAGTGFHAVEIPGLERIPFVGEVLFRQSVPVYVAYFLIPISIFVLYRTSWGLRVIACGENPHAADSAGVNVNRVRYQALLLAGAMAGLGGGVLALSLLRLFVVNLTQGRGFIALAAVLFGNWRPGLVVVGAGLFGVLDALQLRLQAVGVGIPPQALTLLPYVFTLAVLAGVVGKSRPPACFAIPYIRSEL